AARGGRASQGGRSRSRDDRREAGCRSRQPGERYVETRHNLGFWVIEELARRHAAEPPSLECNALVSRVGQIVLARPQTFMNRSGHAVRCLIERHGFAVEDVLVVFDDVTLPLGKLRLRRAGSPGGHRGLESVLESLGTDEVSRLRAGIRGEVAPAGEDLVELVLAPFLDSEKEAVAALVLRAADACELWAAEGAEAAMQRFNG
ncbi:MAG: aminoacyl-tRNA hydrolase, partial [Thermoanaerobaculia bacterium]|nr:aminoacyl-tRNA hydrolase [Thermoanaerobaculia bacterium]